MSFRRNFVAESTDPSTNCSQQNLLNFKRAKFSSAKYFIEENFRSHNVDLSIDYLQQNLLSSRMFISRIFHSKILEMINVHWQNILQQNPRNAECSLAEYFVTESQKFRMFVNRIFHRGKFQKTKYRSFGKLFIAECAKFQKCIMPIAEYFIAESFRSQNANISANQSQQNILQQNILQQNFVLNSRRSFCKISYHKIQY